jgi:hypothetical protein
MNDVMRVVVAFQRNLMQDVLAIVPVENHFGYGMRCGGRQSNSGIRNERRIFRLIVVSDHHKVTVEVGTYGVITFRKVYAVNDKVEGYFRCHPRGEGGLCQRSGREEQAGDTDCHP